MTASSEKTDKTDKAVAQDPSDQGEEPLVFDWLPLDTWTGKPAAALQPATASQKTAHAALPTPPAAVPAAPAEAGAAEAGGQAAPPLENVVEMPPHRVIPLPPRVSSQAPSESKQAGATASATGAVPRAVPAIIGSAPPFPRPKPPALPPSKPQAPEAARPAPAPPRASPRARLFALPPMALLALVGTSTLGAGFLALRFARPPRALSATPQRVRAGQALAIRGENFSAQPQDNAVHFDGKPGRVIRASTDQIEVEVPADVPAALDRDTPISVTVSSRGRETAPLKITSYRVPEIQSLTPDVAMPGDEVVLAGRGWGSQASVAFGAVEGPILEASPQSLRVRVPALEAAPGTSLPLVVSRGEDRSEPVPFLVGRLPLLLSVEPRAGAPGDVLTLKGKGFQSAPGSNSVEIGGERALVVSGGDSELKVVFPWRPAGAASELPVEIRVPGSQHVGASTVALLEPGDFVAFKFAAQPFVDVAGHDHAVLGTELGPCFVLSASGGRAAGERAFEAQQRLNTFAKLIAATGEPKLEIRSAESQLTIGLAGRPEPLLEITDEDAAAYNESGFRGDGGRRVTSGRLASWWLALARDKAALLATDARPRYVAALTPEGRLLAELNDGARRLASSGVRRRALDELRPETRKGLLTFALRVPAAAGEASGTAETPAGAAHTAEDPLELEGLWSGTSTEDGVRKSLTAAFSKDGGTLTYLKPFQFSVPLVSLERPRMGSVRFSARLGTGTRYYTGTWDGETLSGSIAAAPDAGSVVGRFELRR